MRGEKNAPGKGNDKVSSLQLFHHFSLYFREVQFDPHAVEVCIDSVEHLQTRHVDHVDGCADQQQMFRVRTALNNF